MANTYCLKCKLKTEDKNPRTIQEDNRTRQISSCASCNTPKSKFVKTLRGDGKLEAKLSDEAYRDNSRDDVEGYILDRELSNRKTKVYHNPNTNKTVVAHRGTKDSSDLMNDVRVVFGTYDKSKRVQNASEISKKAQEKYGEVKNVGHSLGGTTAAIVAGKNNTEVETFNKGTSPLENYKQTKKKTEHNITVVDPISAYVVKKNTAGAKVVFPTSFNVHGLANFK